MKIQPFLLDLLQESRKTTDYSILFLRRGCTHKEMQSITSNKPGSLLRRDVLQLRHSVQAHSFVQHGAPGRHMGFESLAGRSWRNERVPLEAASRSLSVRSGVPWDMIPRIPRVDSMGRLHEHHHGRLQELSDLEAFGVHVRIKGRVEYHAPHPLAPGTKPGESTDQAWPVSPPALQLWSQAWQAGFLEGVFEW